MIDVRAFSVGPIQENAYLLRSGPEATRALMIDPGEEPQRLLDAASALGVEIEAVLITHCHFDHIGAVAPIASATGAPVYCPVIERGVLADRLPPLEVLDDSAEFRVHWRWCRGSLVPPVH